MGKIGVSLKINVSQIEKERLFSGSKGKYLDATVFIDLDQVDQYGNNGMITQDISKEEKQKNMQGAILGNAKIFWRDNTQQNPQLQQMVNQNYASGVNAQQPNPREQQQRNFNPQEPSIDFDDDIPFMRLGAEQMWHLVV